MKNIKKITSIVLISLFILTGCGKNKIKEIENTSISSNKVSSYRAKVKVKGNDILENYIVLNNNNESYEITFIDKDYDRAIISDGKTTVYNGEEEVKTELSYDYTKTDLFLEGLNDIKITTERTEKIGEDEYKIKEFKISKDNMNKMLKPFNLSSEDGTGYVYLNKDDQVYIVNYKSSDININVSYTRIEKND